MSRAHCARLPFSQGVFALTLAVGESLLYFALSLNHTVSLSPSFFWPFSPTCPFRLLLFHSDDDVVRMSQMVQHLASMRAGAMAAQPLDSTDLASVGVSVGCRGVSKLEPQRSSGNQAIFAIMEARMAALAAVSTGKSTR